MSTDDALTLPPSGRMMACYIYNHSGQTLIRKEERTPVHLQDFCDRCGDCLDCYGGDGCVDGHKEHYWVIYGEPGEKR